MNHVDDISALADEFWEWREVHAPSTTDDLPRLKRPDGWFADWSAHAVAARRQATQGFAARLALLPSPRLPVTQQVDIRLLRSAIDRVRWELDIQRSWQRDPGFYVDQAIVPIFEELLSPPPFSRQRSERIVRYVANVAMVLQQARGNLTSDTPAAFAVLAADTLQRLVQALPESMHALRRCLPGASDRALPMVTDAAVAALDDYRKWLVRQRPEFVGSTAIGAAGFAFFLHRVALYPHPGPYLVTLAEVEQQRAAAAETVLARRAANVPDEVLAEHASELVRTADEAEHRLRRFYEGNGILSQPADLRRYVLAPMPDYLAPLSWYGLPDDLTDPARRTEPAVRYVESPSTNLPYFELATAYDPIVGKLLHEGVHAQQLALSWANPDRIRWRYYDSMPNEGIAFYHEEMMLLAGLFADSPHSARRVANFLLLRALRAELDVGLALGTVDFEQASARIAELVPLDLEAARHEAARLASTPGQMLSYLAGKQQVIDLLAGASLKFGASFELRAFHDRLWREGNVPISLQRWELLDDASHVTAADRLAVTTPNIADE